MGKSNSISLEYLKVEQCVWAKTIRYLSLGWGFQALGLEGKWETTTPSQQFEGRKAEVTSLLARGWGTDSGLEQLVKRPRLTRPHPLCSPVSSSERCFLLKPLFDTPFSLASFFWGKRALFSLRALSQPTGRLLRKGIEAPLENTLRNAVNVLNRAAAFLDETGKASK